MKKTFFIVMATVLLFVLPASAETPVILKAMQDELARSMGQLKLEDEEKPCPRAVLHG